jgi:AcrR family transcriptional regulator
MERMTDTVKGDGGEATEVTAGDPKRRAYDGSRRRSQARAHRARIIEAARLRFLREGYAPTTLASIAADADVSVETVYKSFRNKAGVLKAVFDIAVAGDDAPVPVMERGFVAEIQAEPDAVEKLRRYTRQLEASVPRTAEIQLLVRATAALDPEIEAVWRQMQQERLVGMAAFAAHLGDAGVLRPSTTVDMARVLWTYTSVELYELLVLERGWDLPRYRDFLVDALAAALLPAPTAPSGS